MIASTVPPPRRQVRFRPNSSIQQVSYNSGNARREDVRAVLNALDYMLETPLYKVVAHHLVRWFHSRASQGPAGVPFTELSLKAEGLGEQATASGMLGFLKQHFVVSELMLSFRELDIEPRALRRLFSNERTMLEWFPLHELFSSKDALQAPLRRIIADRFRNQTGFMFPATPEVNLDVVVVALLLMAYPTTKYVCRPPPCNGKLTSAPHDAWAAEPEPCTSVYVKLALGRHGLAEGDMLRRAFMDHLNAVFKCGWM